MDNLNLPKIKTVGVLCEGQLVRLGWPEELEYDSITALRNEPHIRKWFLDSRPIDMQKNREWLKSGMKRPYEAILSIRWKEDDSFLGTIGWSEWDVDRGTAWFGRLAVDKKALKQIQGYIPINYAGIAIDAALTMRDFAFSIMKLNCILTYYFSDNKLAARVNKAIGLVECNHVNRVRQNGAFVETTEMKMCAYS